MLDNPEPRSRVPKLVLFLVAAAIGAGAYYFGKRAGMKAQSAPAVAIAPTPVAPPATPRPAVVAPDAAPPALAMLPDAAPLPVAAAAVGGDAGVKAAPPVVVAAVAPDAGVAVVEAGGHQRLSAVLVGSLNQTVEGASPPTVGPALAMVVARLLVWWMQPAHDARPGDRLDVLYDTPPGQEPLIVALSYRSQKNGAEYRAYRYQPRGGRFARYYRADGSEARGAARRRPDRRLRADHQPAARRSRPQGRGLQGPAGDAGALAGGWDDPEAQLALARQRQLPRDR